MKKFFCLLFALAFVYGGSSHADTLSYDFTTFTIALFTPTGEIDKTAKFTLADGQTPSFYDSGPDYLVFVYDNVDVRYIVTTDGVITSDTTMPVQVEFYVDGVQTVFFAGGNLGRTFYTGSPYSPSFVPGYYHTLNEIYDYVEIVAQTPEPSAFDLVGTGLLGLFGAAVRRLRS